MDYELIIRPEAKSDLLDAFHWYQRQRPGLGLDFKLCVDGVISKIQINPHIYAKLCGLTVLRNMLHFINDQVFQTQRSEKFYGSGSTKGIQANHARKLRMQLAALDTAQTIDDMDIPGYRLHQLTGDSKGIWSIRVNANWRLTFEFTDGNVYILNYEDYH